MFLVENFLDGDNGLARQSTMPSPRKEVTPLKNVRSLVLKLVTQFTASKVYSFIFVYVILQFPKQPLLTHHDVPDFVLTVNPALLGRLLALPSINK